ncbi:MAG: FAD:protein FMN transferase [Gammaproteobacteria bacterium]|jgi:thiamine biosynthesis lipoprotein
MNCNGYSTRARRSAFRLFVVAAIVSTMLSLVSCGKQPNVYYEQFLGFGTLIEVKLWGVNEKTGQQAVRAIADDIDYMHKAWHAWKPGTLSRVNKLLPTGEKITIGPSLIPLIKRGKQYALQSGDRFNPAIGQLIRLWGFESDDLPKGPPPDKEAIDRMLARHPSMQDLTLDGVHLQSSNSAVRLDFGGFAKGYAVDKAIEHLQELGIHNAIVNAGGDLRAIGKHGNRPWRVGIRNPRGKGVLASVDAKADESIFTSGDYERYYEYQGKRYHHIIDPHTGYPARGVKSVTVFDTRADRADAAATAVFVAGVDQWFEVARSMGVSGVMLVADDGTIYMTPNLKQRIHFDVTPQPHIVFSEDL